MSHKRYAILVSFCGVIIFGIITSTLYIWSYLVGEGAAEQVVERQKLNPQSLYLSGIKDNNIDYKLNLFNQLNPNVVAIGSSRSMQVRTSFFKTNFVNFGGTVNSIAELDYVTSRLIKLETKPSIVLIFADIWWFNEKFQNPRSTFIPPNQLNYLTLPNTRLLIKPILKNGVVINKDRRLGFGAVYQNQGYDSSGSFHYVSLVTGEKPSTDFRFQDTFKRIDTGTNRFEYSDSYSNFGALRFNEIMALPDFVG